MDKIQADEFLYRFERQQEHLLDAIESIGGYNDSWDDIDSISESLRSLETILKERSNDTNHKLDVLVKVIQENTATLKELLQVVVEEDCVEYINGVVQISPVKSIRVS